MSFKARHTPTLTEQARMNKLLTIIHREPEFKELREGSNRFQHKRKKPALDATEIEFQNQLDALFPDEPKEEFDPKRELLAAFDEQQTWNQKQAFKANLKMWKQQAEQELIQRDWREQDRQAANGENKYRVAFMERNKRR